MSDTEPGWLTPAEMAERTGTTIDTLRYYEKERLITGVARAASGHRRYSEADAGWIEVLRCLRRLAKEFPAVFAWANKMGLVRSNPCDRVLTVKPIELQAYILTDAEVHSLIAAVDIRSYMAGT